MCDGFLHQLLCLLKGWYAPGFRILSDQNPDPDRSGQAGLGSNLSGRNESGYIYFSRPDPYRKKTDTEERHLSSKFSKYFMLTTDPNQEIFENADLSKLAP